MGWSVLLAFVESVVLVSWWWCCLGTKSGVNPSSPSCVWVITESTATSSKAHVPSTLSFPPSLCSGGIQQLLSPSVSTLPSRMSVSVLHDPLKLSLDFSSLVFVAYSSVLCHVFASSLAAAFPPFTSSASVPLQPGLGNSIHSPPSVPDSEINRNCVELLVYRVQ